MRVVASVLPFKVNDYVLDELIDWDAGEDDPMFRLTFPVRELLPDDIFSAMSALLRSGASAAEIDNAAVEFRQRLNPHPSGQLLNVPSREGNDLPGLQHKYAETLLVFPSQGQTCHSYCGYCFRWAQFVGPGGFRFSGPNPAVMTGYLADHPEITDVLFTGGDPLVMSSDVIARWVEPLLAPELEHVRTVRIGTKALAYWPARMTEGSEATDLLRLIERCVAAGRQVAVMAHITHDRELSTDAARQAVSALRSAGAVVRAQAPIVAHINDTAQDWSRMWTSMVGLGIQPYYTFVDRDTGAHTYFRVPLERALAVHTGAQRVVSGLARTARGPVMSASPGKILVDGEATVAGRRVFVLKMLQSRDPALVGRIFFADHDSDATWIDGLRPAFDDHWPWESASSRASSGPLVDKPT